MADRYVVIWNAPFGATNMAERTISFGKHRGQSVSDLIRSDPQYLLWADQNVSRFKLTGDERRQCQAASKGQRGAGASSYGGPRADRVVAVRDDTRNDDDMEDAERYYEQDF